MKGSVVLDVDVRTVLCDFALVRESVIRGSLSVGSFFEIVVGSDELQRTTGIKDMNRLVRSRRVAIARG